MIIVGVLILFIGLLAAGAGAGMALFERWPPRRTLRLMGIGMVVAAVGLVVSVLSADDGESLSAGTFVSLAVVVAIVAYATWFANTKREVR